MQGAWLTREGVCFRVYAPAARTVEVEVDGRRYPMERAPDGHFKVTLAETKAGDRYRYVLDGSGTWPDPCSYYQPDGPHGPSQVIHVVADGVMGRLSSTEEVPWTGVNADHLVLYECHVGCMSPEGTFDGLIARLDDIKALGATVLQLMPVAEFPGRWNWGYDGVDWFAPSHHYGGPDGLRRLVDAAHRRGLGVFLDVVYNHLGPDGNYLSKFNPAYFTDRYHTPWGAAFNFDGPDSGATRRLVSENALYWLEGFDIDGLRLDATHQLYDVGETHILERLAYVAHRMGDKFVVAEDERNDASLLHKYRVDALYADDFHHSLHVLLTGERDGYYADFDGTADELARIINEGWLYQGQTSSWTGRPRGTKLGDVAWRKLVYCLQNHDQVGNRAAGERLHQLPGVTLSQYVAASALLLTLPQTPLIFMGQEYAASTPFQFFSDHEGELGRKVTEGRRREFEKFAAFHHTTVPDPQDEATFRRSVLRWEERASGTHAEVLRQYQALLGLRAGWKARSLKAEPVGAGGLRVTTGDGARERLLVVRLQDEAAGPAPGDGWKALWSSDDEKAVLYER